MHLNSNEKLLPIIDGFRNEMKSLLTRVQESENREKRCKGRWHDVNKETTEQLNKLSTELSKLNIAQQRQAVIEELTVRENFNHRRHQTADSSDRSSIPVQHPSTLHYQKSIQTKIQELE